MSKYSIVNLDVYCLVFNLHLGRAELLARILFSNGAFYDRYIFFNYYLV